MKLFSFKIKDIEDDPKSNSCYPRKWEDRFEMEIDGSMISIGKTMYMTMFKGVKRKGHPVQIGSFAIELNPFKWNFGIFHIYYNGPNCAYWLGPFCYNTNRRDCDKCYEGHE